MSPADCLKRFGIYGSLIHGPLVHLWLSAITRLLPGTTPFLVLVKVVTDQVPFSLFFRFLAEVACILFLLTGNICACHIHLLLSRPGTFGGAEDWLVRPLAREGTHRVGQRLFVSLAKKATICASPTIKLFSRCPQPGPQASVSGHSWLLSVTAPCPLTCDPFIYPFAGNLNVL